MIMPSLQILFNILDIQTETTESTPCSWELKILKERSSFIEGHIDTEKNFIQKEDINTPFTLTLSKEHFDHNYVPSTKKSVNNNTCLADDLCKTPASNKENEKECDMNMSNNDPDVTLFCKTSENNHASELKIIKESSNTELDDRINFENTNKKIKSRSRSRGMGMGITRKV